MFCHCFVTASLKWLLPVLQYAGRNQCIVLWGEANIIDHDLNSVRGFVVKFFTLRRVTPRLRHDAYWMVEGEVALELKQEWMNCPGPSSVKPPSDL